MQITENGIVYQVDFLSNRATVCKIKNDLKHIEIPETIGGIYTVKEIGHRAFCNNRCVEEVILPNSIVLVGESAFEGCIYLKEIHCKTPLAPIIVLKRAFCMCYNLEQLGILGKIIINEDAVFQDCYSLKDLPCEISGLIKQNTFFRCKKLEAIRFEDIRLLPRSFNNVPALKTLIIVGKLQAAKLTLKKLINYEIHCPENSPLLELAYNGQKIIIL